MNHVTFITSLRARLATVWPEAIKHGSYHAAQIARVSFEEKARRGEVPFVAFDMQMRRSMRGGSANQVKEGPVAIYYVVTDDVLLEDTLITKLETLRASLFGPTATDLDYGQVMADPDISFSLELPLNQYFLNSQRPFLGGAVIAQMLGGETDA